MGGVCLYRTCRPVWTLFIVLGSIPSLMFCSESRAAAVGKMYPRGNHWAVGHLMGKKSIDTLPELQGTNQDYVTPPHTAGATELHPYERLAAALVHHKNQKQTSPPAAGSLLWLRSGWREDDRDKYLREMSDLLLPALQDNDEFQK